MLTNHVTVIVSLSRLQNGVVFLAELRLDTQDTLQPLDV